MEGDRSDLPHIQEHSDAMHKAEKERERMKNYERKAISELIQTPHGRYFLRRVAMGVDARDLAVLLVNNNEKFE